MSNKIDKDQKIERRRGLSYIVFRGFPARGSMDGLASVDGTIVFLVCISIPRRSIDILYIRMARRT
jgi:hypothetical protein